MKRLGAESCASLAETQVIETFKSIEDLALVVFDPFSRFYSENEIDAVQQTFFVSLMERITQEVASKPNVLIAAHVNKASGQNRGKAGLIQEMIRGATGLTAGARWQMGLIMMDDAEIKKACGDMSRPYNYMWGKVVKKNVGPPESVFALEKGEGGVLSRLEIVNAGGLSDDDTIMKIADKILELEADGTYKTVNTFVDSYAGVYPGYGRVKLKELIEDALTTKKLFVVPRKAKNGVERAYLSVTEF